MIKSGDVIQGPWWPEPVEVKLVEVVGDGAYYRIVGALQHTHTHVDRLMSTGDLDKLSLARIETGFAADPRHVFLSLEALRYRFAALYDPLLAMNTSKVDPLPHQIEAVYGYLLQLPRIRFLIADDPGAGKTIMAGLAIKELKLRKQASRILIVAPGHLKDQWRRELRDRFEESFTAIDRGLMDATYGENVWARENQLITSIDFAKQDDILASLNTTHFDLVIVDEAHKLAAYRYGADLRKTIRYRLGEVLAANSTHLLFLTATPHRGDPENFRLFLDLLEPGFFATTEMVAESIRNQDNPLFIRRIKEDLKNFDGEPLFLPRHVDTKSFDLGVESPAEKNLYNDLSQYVREQYNKALTREDRRRNIFFALVILQRRLASSTYALLQSLERRHKRLQDILHGATTKRADTQSGVYDIEEADDLSEEERWQREELWETLSVAENRYELEREIGTLEGLIKQARTIINSGSEVKLRHLQEALSELNKEHPGAQILIFTESRDTLDYLQRRIKEWGYTVTAIHGGMKMEERIAAEGTFRNEAQVMVATEAAGEGINLQFCNLMINYDIPWTPTRLEQRMGRIHRYGQNREVFIFNLVAVDTREGKVLHKLFDKLKEIESALGSDKVFDVLGDILQGKNLAELLVQAASSARSVDEILAELDIQVDQAYVGRVRENLGESLATRYIDYTRIKEMADQALEHRLIPEYTEAFFKKAIEAVGGRIRTRGNTGELTQGRHLLAIESIPSVIRQIADEPDFRKRHGPVQRQYTMVTFDKEIAQRTPKAEFISFGHPLFEAVLVWVERNLATALQQGAIFSDPDGRLDGLLLYYEGDIQDGLGHVTGRRLFALYYDLATAEITPANPAGLWDLEEGGGGSKAETPGLDTEAVKRLAWATLLPMLEEYKGEIGQERQRQAQIKEKYGVASLEHLVIKLDGELIDLYTRLDRGESVELPTRNKEDQKRRYELALGDLRNNVERERSLTITTPRFVGIARVVPKQVVNEAEVDDPNIERIGMDISMQHERDHQRTPEDVAKQNLGFDVRSVDSAGRKRYIEVKARTGEWPVQLTQNEWFKAQRFGEDYYLYVVLNAVSDPKLYIIQNPAAILQPQEQIEVRYAVSVGDIKAQGEKA